MSLVSAAGALVLGALVGVPWPVLATVAGAWGVSVFARGILQILLRLGAAMVITVAAPITHVDALRLVLAGALVVAVMPPLLESLGPGRLAPRALIVPGGSLVLMGGLLALAPARAILSSDLAVGFTIVALGAGVLAIASALVARARGRNG